MARMTRVEINIANNAELRANSQRVLDLTRAARPKNTSLAYGPKQSEFKARINPAEPASKKHAVDNS